MSTEKTTTTNTAARNKIEDMYPLSPMQQGLLFHSLLAPGSGLYMPHIIIHLSGELDTNVLRSAWEDVISEHPVLRTGFFWEQRDEPFQLVSRSVNLPWVEQDWSELKDEEQQQRLNNFIAASRTQVFNLNRAPLMRLSWIHRGNNRYTLIWAYHHLILDGWSAARVLEQVITRLLAAEKGVALPASPPSQRFGDYIAWLARQNQEANKAFWQSHVQPAQAKSSMPLPPPAELSSSESSKISVPGLKEIALNNNETKQLQAFAREQQVTLNTLIQGAFALLLAQYNNANEIIFGNTVSGRPADLPGSASMVGLFINTLPVQISLSADDKVGDCLRNLQQRQAETVAHEHVALRELQEWTNNGRALFECLFVFESYPLPTLPEGEVSKLSLDGVVFDEQTHFPLTLLVADGETLGLSMRYSTLRYDPKDVEQLLDQLRRLALAMTVSADAEILGLSPLSDREQARLSMWSEQSQSETQVNLTTDVEMIAPRNPTEALVAQVWSEVLNIETIDMHDNFLAIGGHSLNATRVNTRLRQQLDIELPLHAHFRYTTPEALANHIDALRMAEENTSASTTAPADTSKRIEIEI